MEVSKVPALDTGQASEGKSMVLSFVASVAMVWGLSYLVGRLGEWWTGREYL